MVILLDYIPPVRMPWIGLKIKQKFFLRSMKFPLKNLDQHETIDFMGLGLCFQLLGAQCPILTLE